jgi:hypothetical protein
MYGGLSNPTQFPATLLHFDLSPACLYFPSVEDATINEQCKEMVPRMKQSQSAGLRGGNLQDYKTKT